MSTAHKPRWLVPEVVQSSAMDCGPASLKAILEGFGIHASYGRLREACQTEIDGTSIDTLEEVAVAMGLDAEQVMVPADHLLLDEAELLPALVVVQRPSGGTHFVVAWRRHGPLIQLMDPATGRRWQTRRAFLRDLYHHSFKVPAADWLEWADSEDFERPFIARLQALGLDEKLAREMISEARAREGWQALATLDAATRFTASMIRSGAVQKGKEGLKFLHATLARAFRRGADALSAVPSVFWSVRPDEADEDGPEQLVLHGAVLIRFRRPAADPAETTPALPPDLKSALEEPPQHPGRELWRLLREDGLLPPLAVASGLLLSAATVMIEVLLFRGLLDIGRFLGFAEQRLATVGVVAALILGLLLLAVPTAALLRRSGRHLDLHFRMAFLAKIPLLGDRYFHSRLSSDMAERAHTTHLVGALPSLAAQLWGGASLLLATTVGIVWLDPASAPLAIATAGLSLILPLISQGILLERDLRVRTHVGALTRFSLDSMLGLAPLRCHGAERAMRREHEMLLVEWARASLALLRALVATEGLAAAVGFALAAWLLVAHLGRAGETGMVLLLAYWVLSLPAIGQELAFAARQIPSQRNVALRLAEPLGARNETKPDRTTGHRTEASRGGVALRLDRVSVQLAGHTILEDLRVDLPAGSHVAIVGRSGAGKSSLLGLLLGWLRATTGTVLVDERALDGEGLDRLRRETAWVDPAVRLWNRSLLDNLSYGNRRTSLDSMEEILETAKLFDVLQGLPEGLQTVLGEAGGLVSGGEGQRVRFARAFARSGVRLVILDEPFRGLDRDRRRAFLNEARAHWAEATLLCVTHDIHETLDFERVLVIDDGRIVEDGMTSDLHADPQSRFSRLLAADERVREAIWSDPTWRRVRLRNGRLHESRVEESP